MTDQELLISTLRKAGRIIGEYIEPGPRDAEQTLSRLIAVLETQDLARAIERIERGHGLRVVKLTVPGDLATDHRAGSTTGDVSGNSLISRTSTLSPGRYR